MISDRARAIVSYFSNACAGCSLGYDCEGNDAACAPRDQQERFVQEMLDMERGDDVPSRTEWKVL